MNTEPRASSRRLWLLRAWRAAALAALGFLVWWQARTLETKNRRDTISLSEARLVFPRAAALSPAAADGSHAVYDEKGMPFGSVLRTSPQADGVVGYSGPSDVLIGLNAEGAVAGARLLHSRDTVDHAAMVERDVKFWQQFEGWKPDAPFPKIEAVSGATLTASAIAEAVHRRLHGGVPSLRFPDAVTLDEVRALFPNAVALTEDGDRLRVTDTGSTLLGYAVRTSPAADSVNGYRGPTESLVALDPDGKTIRAVKLRKSYDTASYVQQVRDDEWYLPGFKGRSVAQMAAMDFQKEGIEGVSGATLTSWAVAEGMKRKFAARPAPAPSEQPWRPALRDWLAAGVVCGALVMAFTRLRGVRAARVTWQALLMVWALWSGGDLLSAALLSGWAQHGVPWAAASGAALIAGVALFIPWAARRQIYCHHICPHGAAQQWLGKLRQHKPSVPPRVDRVLRVVSWLLLAAVPLLLLFSVDVARIEPFDAWVWRAAAWVPLAIAVAGLVASIFIPQAYCRYGCPTGALLTLVRTSGAGDRWGRRDAALAMLIGVASISATIAAFIPTAAAAAARPVLRGAAMGTTWEVTIRGGAVTNADSLQQDIATRLAEIESEWSNWRSGSAVSLFNAARHREPVPMPSDMCALAAFASEMSVAAGGAFDITAGPLVRLWGFGPAPRPETPPSAEEIQNALAHTGWQRLRIAAAAMQKDDPLMEVDLTALTEGYAAEQIATLLQTRGAAEYLINIGGELRARGAWAVAIEHPLRTLVLRDAALATAGTYRQNRETGGQRSTHLIDARTGHPVTHHTVSVSVRHNNAAFADGWATALNILGREAGMPLAEGLGLAAEFVEEHHGEPVITATSSW
jgi:NosR/NirI family nitrous oxide reductase transcriptional regulator